MKTREDRHVGISHRRWLTPALLITLVVAGALIGFGSQGSVVQSGIDARTASVIAARWSGIPVGAALWLGFGVVVALLGVYLACRSPAQPSKVGVVEARRVAQGGEQHHVRVASHP